MTARRREFSRAHRGYFLALTATISAFAVIDRIALLTVGQAIKDDLGISDFEFGLVSGLAFAAVYALVGLPLARLADTGNRVRLIAWSIAIWSVFSMLGGFARSFVQLMLCRVVVGIGEAGVQPPAVAIVSDLYPREKRGTALALLSIGLPVGTLAGAIGAGYLADAYSWRTVFVILGVPGLLLALIAWATLRDPPRGLSDGLVVAAGDPAPRTLDTIRHLARLRSFRHIVAGLALTYFAAAGIGSFLPQYFARTFALGLGATGLMFGLVASGSNLVGNVAGGVTVDWISRRDPRWYAWLPGIGIFCAAPLYILSFTIPEPVLATAVLVLAGMVLFLHYAPAQAALQNMVEPRMRATAAFVFFFIVTMLGYGVGPTLLGLVSDMLAARAFAPGDFAAACLGGAADPATAARCRHASARGIGQAMTAMSGLFFWAGIHFLIAARTVAADLYPVAGTGDRAAGII
ncbi:MAG: MFS transporter [Sphingomonas sp.]